MTYSAEHPKAAWSKVMKEALKQPFNAGLLDLGFAAAHFAGAAMTGNPFLARLGCAWAMMGATYFGLHAQSIISPGTADKVHALSRSVRSQKPALAWQQAVLEVAKHPIKSGAVEIGAGVASVGVGAVASNPYLIGIGSSAVAIGTRRMGNYLAGVRFPELIAS